MADVTDHIPMTPSWIDIGTDVEGAKAFYTSLFGWGTQGAGPSEETGGYGFFTKDDKWVAGYGPQQNPGPPFWSTYISVADADQVAEDVEAAGGQVVVPAMDVMDAGRMAVFTDAAGAFISAWQPGQHKGAQVVREAGAFSWCELATRDPAASEAFYKTVFGWGAETHEGPMPYTEFRLGGGSIAGMMPMPDTMPAEVPPHWRIYIQVDDVEATVTKTQELGGSVLLAGMDYPGGRLAIVSDPQGATFGVMKPAT